MRSRRARARLAHIVQTSARVASAPARLGKVRLCAACSRAVGAPEIAIAVHFLSGGMRQGRIGIGGALLGAD